MTRHLVDEFDAKWKTENWTGLTGAWDHPRRIGLLDADALAPISARIFAPISARIGALIGPEQSAFA
ncbi:MAG: hypothetical protein KC616_16310 [Myxococcales bacterium]|nr:hypothetical protein [Myxococcales bacterium]